MSIRDATWLFIGGALILSACSDEGASTEKLLRPVRTYQVRQSSGGRTKTFSGTARAGTESKLSFKVGGAIRVLDAKVGDRVKKGQLIAALDDKDYRLQLREAQASYVQVAAQARNAKAEHERVQRLYENRNASLKDLDATRAAADSARASVAASRQRVELARRQLDYCTLESPVEGQIAATQAEVNENVTIGKTIAVLNSGVLPEVAIAVPESMIARIKRGDEAEVTFDALRDQRFAALVTEVGVATTGDTTFTVLAQLAEPQRSIRAGMAAVVRLELDGPESGPRIFVPAHSVLEDQEGRFVFTAEGQAGQVGTVQRRVVAIGGLAEEGIEVVRGLATGDRVVVGGLRFVEPGMKVRIFEEVAKHP